METKKIKEIRVGDKVYTMSEDDFNKLRRFKQDIKIKFNITLDV